MQEIDRLEMLDVLQKVLPGVSKASTKSEITVGAISGFIFTGSDIAAFNENLCIHHPFETEFQTIVPARDLYDILSKVKEDKINIGLNKNKFLIETKSMKANMNAIEQDDMLLNAIDSVLSEIKEWGTLPNDFCTALEYIHFPSAKYILCNNNILYCTDGQYQLSRYVLSDNIPSFAILPNIGSQLSPYNVDAFCLSDSWIHFSNPLSAVVSVKLFSSEEIKAVEQLESFFQVEGTIEFHMPEGMEDHIDLVSILGKESSSMKRTVEMSFKKNSVIFHSHNDNGEITKKVSIKHSIKDIAFSINSTQLLKILKKASVLTIHDKHIILTSGSYKHAISRTG